MNKNEYMKILDAMVVCIIESLFKSLNPNISKTSDQTEQDFSDSAWRRHTLRITIGIILILLAIISESCAISDSTSISIEEALDTSLNFTTGGDALWFGQDAVSYFGGDAAQAGRISDSDGQNTWIQTNVTDIGALSFFWMVSSGSGHYLKFYIDDMEMDEISGEVNWTMKSYSIGAGNHTLKWMYTNDFGYPAGNDTGWIDKIEFSPSVSVQEAIDNSAFNFTSGGDAIWFGQKEISYFGGDSAQAGRISEGKSTWLQANVTDIGAISFVWKVSSGFGNYLEFYIDDIKLDSISDEVNWTLKNYSVGAGAHTLKWLYVNEYGYIAGSNTGWIDKIELSPSVSIGEAVDNTSLNFTSGGDADWFGQKEFSYFGGAAAQAGRIIEGQSTWIQTNVTDIGVISFFWKVSSGMGNYLEFYIDDIKLDYISDEVDWTQKNYSVGAGSHTLKWRYVNNYGYISGSDTGWIDKIELSPSVSIGEAIDNTSLNFTSGGDADWFGQKEFSYFGGDAAQSGRISRDQSTWIQTNVTDIGWLSFYWKVSSGSVSFVDNDLEFYIDGVLIDSISYEINWKRKSYNIGQGDHTLKWNYKKGSDGFSVDDGGWIDKIVFSASDTKFINDNTTGGDCTLIGIWNPATKTCKLTNDLGEKIQIDSDGITLDGNGYTITGSNTGNGVYLLSRTGVTIKNLNVHQFSNGICLSSSGNNTLTGNNVSNNDVYGIYLFSSSNNTLRSNRVLNNYWIGISLESYSSNNMLTGNHASNNGKGISLDSYSINNILTGNHASNNGNGISISTSNNNQLDSNNAFNNSGNGIYLDSSSNNTLTGNNVTYNLNGIFLKDSKNNVLDSNIASNSIIDIHDDFECNQEYRIPDGNGIYLYYSDNNNLSDNNASNNTCSGLYAAHSSSNIFNSNSVSNNGVNKWWGYKYGILLDSSSYSILINNSMTGNFYNFGIKEYSDSIFDNIIDTSNTVDGKPILYIKNGTNIVYDSSSNAGTVYCIWCNNITIKNLILIQNGNGIIFWKTNNSKVENVTASYNDWGISLGYSSNNFLGNNTAYYNQGGIEVSLSSNNNTVSGNSVLINNYLNIVLWLSSDNKLIGNLVDGGNHTENGIHVDSSNHNELSRNNATENTFGIQLINSNNNTLDGNNASNGACGIFLSSSSNNKLSGNNANSNTDEGIYVSSSNNNTLIGNNANWNDYITYLVPSHSGNGISLDYSNNNTLIGNNANWNGYGIYVFSSSNNTMMGNNANSNRKEGIFVRSSANNIIYHNNFIQNYNGQALDMTGGNTWDNGYPIGGNYWSDYNGVDLNSGYSQNITGSDGIGDTLYTIEGCSSMDNYPLMTPQTPVISIESITGEGTVYFDIRRGIIQDLTAVKPDDIPETPPPEANLNYGLFRFNITGITAGGSVTLTLTFPEILPAGTTYRKYGANAANNTPHWYTIPSTINGNKITITLVDGADGDDDLVINGMIKDDGGPSLPANEINIAPVADCGNAKLGCENAGIKVQFNGTASYDLDGTIRSYDWEFGDGGIGTGDVPNHTYALFRWNGTVYEPFILNLTVTDNTGLMNKTSKKVVIWMAGDANGDGKVNILDASVVGLKWNGNDPCADLNNDGAVNILDASIIGLNWGKSAINFSS